MALATEDGEWVGVRQVLTFDCTKCGEFLRTGNNLNDWEMKKAIQKHAQEKHGGLWTPKPEEGPTNAT